MRDIWKIFLEAKRSSYITHFILNKGAILYGMKNILRLLIINLYEINKFVNV